MLAQTALEKLHTNDKNLESLFSHSDLKHNSEMTVNVLISMLVGWFKGLFFVVVFFLIEQPVH